MLPTLLFAAILSLTLFGCDSGGSSNSGATRQPTTSASNPPRSNSHAAASPSSNSTASKAGAGSTSDIKLTVVKYITTTDSNPGFSTHYLGIVKNEGSITAKELMVRVVDDSGQVQEQPAGDVEYALLPPGQSAGFNMDYVGGDIKHPQFNASGTAITADDPQPAQLSIVSSQFATSPTGG